MGPTKKTNKMHVQHKKKKSFFLNTWHYLNISTVYFRVVDTCLRTHFYH